MSIGSGNETAESLFIEAKALEISKSHWKLPSKKQDSLLGSNWFKFLVVPLFAAFFGWLVVINGNGILHLRLLKVSSAVQKRCISVAKVAIVDAGSTATRVHLYEFVMRGNNVHSLQHDHFVEEPIGLASFAKNPQQAAEFIGKLLSSLHSGWRRRLLRIRKQRIPIVVRATAGLRLLADDEAEELLSAIRSFLSNNSSIFYISQDSSVAMLSGSEECLFAWQAAHFLLPWLAAQKIAIVELGGASLQVAFEVSESNDERLAILEVNGMPRTMYQNSFLGYGLMEARKLYERMNLSACEDATLGWKQCYKSIQQILNVDALTEEELCGISGVYQPKIEAGTQVLVFSYLNERIREAHGPLIDADWITLGHLQELVSTSCYRQEKKGKWWCFDITFAFALLKDGMRLDASQKIWPVKKAGEFEVCWCVGAALQAVEAMEKEKARKRKLAVK